MHLTRVTTRVLTGALVMLACTVGARAASALVACTAADIVAQDGSNCPPGLGACTIKKDFDIPTGCTLDFGNRDVTLANLAVLSIAHGGVVTFKARNFTVGAGGYIDGRGTNTLAPDNAGAFISIQATQAVSVLRTTLTGRIEVSATSIPGSIEIIAGTAVPIQGRLEADSLGTADGGTIDITAGTDISSISGSDISAVGAGGGVGGSVEMTAGGKVDLGATVDLDGYDGGNLSIDSGAETKLSAVNQKGVGSGSSMIIEAGLGGTLDVLAGTFVQILGRITSTGTGGGCGGDVSLEADFGAITIAEQILAEASLPEATETGAGGGTVTLFAVGPINITSTGKVSARSDGTLGFGGAICIETDDALTGTGAIDASGGQCGGQIDISAQANITFSNLVSAAARNYGGFGGTVTVAAGDFGKGNLTINDTIDVTGGACSVENGCGVAGSTDLTGCDVTVGATGHIDARAPGGGGSNLLTVREQLRVQGNVEAQATDVTGINGTNEFVFPVPKPPIITATVNPLPTLTARSRCLAAGVPDAFCLAPCPTCGNGIVEYPESCDTAGTPVNCDGCTRFCQAENCNDGNGCTTDTCDPTLGCRNILVLPCFTPTPSGPSPTPTSTPTRTNTPLPAATPTITATFTNTPTRTNTPTPTNTPTFTNTATTTPTSTSTNTPTITPTFTNTPTPTITLTPTATVPSTFTPTGAPPPTATPPVTRFDDSVVSPVKPISVTIPLAVTEILKVVKVKVTNADILPEPETLAQPVKLIVHQGDCPASVVVGLPDFDIRTAGDQDTIMLRGGRGKKAVIRLRLQSSAFTSFNRITPRRCTLQLEAKTDIVGSGDPNPTNNFAPLEVNVIDRNDPDQATLSESEIDSGSPMTFTLRKGKATLRKVAKPRVLNGNLTAIVAHAISVSASGACPPAAMGPVDFDSRTAGTQPGAAPPGGKVRGAMDVNANAVDFASPNKKSPGRCVLTFTATGPSGDTDGTNNVTQMVVDVVDKNDF